MRALACLVLSLLALALPALADDTPYVSKPFADRPAAGPPDRGEAPVPGKAPPATAKPPVPAKSHEQILDDLFAELKRESAADKADAIAARIQAEWLKSGSATTDLLMEWAGEAMARKNTGAALDLLDQVTVLNPGYAEGWNRRATLHYTRSHYGLSTADVRQVLAREPRHFGALMGLGTMLEETDRKREALRAFTRVLEIYPAMRGAQDAVARLSEELAGQAI